MVKAEAGERAQMEASDAVVVMGVLVF